MNLKEITAELKKKGFRTTALRKALLEVLLKLNEPVSVADLETALKGKGVEANKTSVYRQLETLVTHGVVETVVINPKVQLFELKKHHHHHFVCDSCDDVQDVHSEKVEIALTDFEHELQKMGLTIKKHDFTLYGECQSCH